MADDKKVLSIQSTVVHGYVGNKSATFPLQLHGYDVSPINSVQFSNHTGYGKWTGQVLDAAEVSSLFEGLVENNLMDFSHVLTGYIGSESFLKTVGKAVRDMKSKNPHLVYVCDPVMGDNGELYVSDKLVPVYKDDIIQLADILTPNQFELEILTGSTITTEAEAFAAIDKIHLKGVSTVVLSSSDLGDDKTLLCLASHKDNGSDAKRYKLRIPKLDSIFTGTGDLFAASLLTWMDKEKNLKVALEKTVCVVQSVINRTFQYASSRVKDSKPNKKDIELRLVQSRAEIENPQVILTAEEVL